MMIINGGDDDDDDDDDLGAMIILRASTPGYESSPRDENVACKQIWSTHYHLRRN